ncbi:MULTISPECIES: TetR/AcrR family transcriptional regulator [unclassified Pseudofrankia]|uniref:TetR/AcrR family transcriptional regulator n=1 Tax=unclassified Pseudofrankia TaxID=2994372 RepID=UPI000A5255CD|nr:MULTISPECIES: TetR/AcrR family transcriptional regulator [unclassified Pseudofrankia]MDT3446674.1 TetR/AcrR family transcriptional regulator [Pseudofrankia sp. BMG5.37]
MRKDARGIHTRDLLLRTAERLFASQGIARTSTRQITAEAGISRDAIHYHFGSKATLVLAIVDARTEELRAEIERLFAVNVPDRDITIRDIAHAMVVAATEMAEHETGRYYHPFLVALMNDPEFRHLVNSRSSPQSEAVVALLTPLTPGVGEAERVYRVACALVLVLFGTGNGGVAEWVSSQVETTQGHLLIMLTDTVTNVLAGGVPTTATAGASGRGGAPRGREAAVVGPVMDRSAK